MKLWAYCRRCEEKEGGAEVGAVVDIGRFTAVSHLMPVFPSPNKATMQGPEDPFSPHYWGR